MNVFFPNDNGNINRLRLTDGYKKDDLETVATGIEMDIQPLEGVFSEEGYQTFVVFVSQDDVTLVPGDADRYRVYSSANGFLYCYGLKKNTFFNSYKLWAYRARDSV